MLKLAEKSSLSNLNDSGSLEVQSASALAFHSGLPLLRGAPAHINTSVSYTHLYDTIGPRRSPLFRTVGPHFTIFVLDTSAAVALEYAAKTPLLEFYAV